MKIAYLGFGLFFPVFSFLSEHTEIIKLFTCEADGVYQKEPDMRDYILSERSSFSYADRVLRAFYGFPVLYDNGKALIEVVRGAAVPEKNGETGLKIQDGTIVTQ